MWYLCVNISQTVPTELVKKASVLQMLHNHTDELRVSRRKGARVNVNITAALRHSKPKWMYSYLSVSCIEGNLA